MKKPKNDEEYEASAEAGAAGAESGDAGEDAGPEDPDGDAGPRISDGLDTPPHIDEVSAPAVELDIEEELADLRDRHLRLAAEFDNFRRRTRQELLKTGEMARAQLAARLLEGLDDLQRVADIPADQTTTEALHQGVELVERKLLKELGDAGLEVLKPLGERFDPNLHEAILLTPTADREQDELVAHVVKIGYKLGDRLLRPAQVGVYRYDEDAGKAGEQSA